MVLCACVEIKILRRVRLLDGVAHPTHWLICTQVGSGAALPGLEEAILGIKKGGVRRIVVPTRLSYTQPLKSSPGPVPDDYGARRQIERELAKMDP